MRRGWSKRDEYLRLADVSRQLLEASRKQADYYEKRANQFEQMARAAPKDEPWDGWGL